MDIRELKAKERRKLIRKYIRQRLTEVEIAKRLGVDVSTVSEDVAIIRDENSQRVQAHKELVDKDIDALLQSLNNISDMDEESWNIFYEATDSRTKLDALEKIRQNNLDRAKLLKLLNPTQVNIEKIVYMENKIVYVIDKLSDIVLEYTPKEKQIEALEKIKVIVEETKNE